MFRYGNNIIKWYNTMENKYGCILFESIERVMMRIILDKFKEVSSSVIPIVMIVLVLSFTLVPLDADMILKFLLCAVIIIIGLGLFLVGTEVGVYKMGKVMGTNAVKANNRAVVFLLGVIFGFVISIAEADLLILANQVSAVTDGLLPPFLIVGVVSLGVGIMIGLGFLRILLDNSMSRMFIVFYLIIFGLFFFVSEEFQAISFDASGATTGAMTTPFILALGMGVSSMKSSGQREEDSFGLVGAASAGAIWPVMLMSLILGLSNITGTAEVVEAQKGIIAPILAVAPKIFKESLIAITPILVVFFIFNLLWFKRPKKEIRIIYSGMLLAFVGLLLFMIGVNAGFMDIARVVGITLAEYDSNKILLPIVGFIIGLVVVLAEPAVYVLANQVEEVTAGSIPKKMILVTLSIGVGFAVSMSMVKIVFEGVKLWMFLVPGFFISLILSRKIPPIFVGIAFDSGGVASGPMTATFVLALTQGVATAIPHADVLVDGFGVIAMVAMMPILSISILGMIYQSKTRKEGQK